MSRARTLARCLLLPAALFALGCALLTPTEAGQMPVRPGVRDAMRQEQGRRGLRELPAGSTVRGRVVYDDTSRPARRARLMLVGGGGARTEHGALTDARGEFRIHGVQAGSYFAFVDVPGVLSPVAFLSLGELRGGDGPGVPDLGEGRAFFDIIEVDGKEDVDVTVHARRGASIAGRVTYADGDPAVNVTINLMRRDAAGRLQKFLTGANLVSLSGLRTDDRGMFRLTGLPPGEYVVGVSEAVEHSPHGTRRRADDIPGMVEAMLGQQLLMTFHPSATSAKDAAAVKLAAGDERTDVDVRIPERSLRTVSGVALARRDKRPLARARVTIERRDDPLGASATAALYDLGELMTNATTTDEEGRWQFTEIPDGPYAITVKPAEEYETGAAAAYAMNSNMSVANVNVSVGNMNGSGYRPPRRKRGYAPARRDVDVSGADLSDVQIESGDGGLISGRVSVEGGGAVEYAHIDLLRVPDGAGASAADDTRNTASEGGRFSFEGLPAGRFFLRPRTYTGEATLYVKSINWNGKDLLREPLELGEGAMVEGVEVVFARNPATLRLSAVRAGTRKPASYAYAFLVPADAPAWSRHSAGGLSCSTAEEGFCSVQAPPGEYHVVVLPRKPTREMAEAEVRRRTPASPRVVLRAGETKEFEAAVPDR